MVACSSILKLLRCDHAPLAFDAPTAEVIAALGVGPLFVAPLLIAFTILRAALRIEAALARALFDLSGSWEFLGSSPENRLELALPLFVPNTQLRQRNTRFEAISK